MPPAICQDLLVKLANPRSAADTDVGSKGQDSEPHR